MSERPNTGSNHAWWQDLFEELKRRRVFRVATLYVVIFWPLIQLVDILTPAIGLTDSAMRYLVLTFFAGLAIVLVLAWLFDLNQSGLVRDTGTTPGETGNAMIGSRTEMAIIMVMLGVVAGLFYLQFQVEDEVSPGVYNTSPQEAGATPSRSNSIAVLPFVSFSQEDRDRFFADGLSEELLNMLARVQGLQVAARTSSFAYRGVSKNVQTIGKELNVGVILEGSVRRNDIDNTIRVTAQLIDTRDGNHFWSKTWDREFTDVFKIQDEIAAGVVNELKITLLGDEVDQIRSRADASPEAMITYSMGQAELAKRTRISMDDAVRFFKRAIDIDPNYVDAWVGLADAYNLLASYLVGDRQANLLLAEDAIGKALTLDAGSGRAWASKGLLLRLQSRDPEAKEALEKAIELSPNYAMAHMWYAPVSGDPDAEFKHFEKAYQLDPRSPVAGYNIAQQYLLRGREADAMQVFAQIVEADPFYPRAYQLVGSISARRGRLGDAIRQYEKAYELDPSPDMAYDIADMMTTLGNFSSADEWVALAKPNEPPERLFLYDILAVKRLAMTGDQDGVNALLEKMSKPARDDELAYLVAALASYMARDYESAVLAWEKSDAVRVGAGQVNAKSPGNIYNEAVLGVAYSYLQLGQDEKAESLIADVQRNLEPQMQFSEQDASLWYRLAQLSMLGGETQHALINLQRAVDEGWTEFWLPHVDPILSELSSEPELQSMMAGLQTRMNLMRERIAFEESFATTSSRTSSGG